MNLITPAIILPTPSKIWCSGASPYMKAGAVTTLFTSSVCDSYNNQTVKKKDLEPTQLIIASSLKWLSFSNHRKNSLFHKFSLWRLAGYYSVCTGQGLWAKVRIHWPSLLHGLTPWHWRLQQRSHHHYRLSPQLLETPKNRKVDDIMLLLKLIVIVLMMSYLGCQDWWNATKPTCISGVSTCIEINKVKS